MSGNPEMVGWDCPICDTPAVTLTQGQYIGILQCMNCGWSMSVDEWNSLSKEEKKKLRKKKRRFKLFGK